MHALPQQRRRHLHRRDREDRRHRGPTGRRAPSGSTTTTTGSSTCSSAASSSSRSRRTSSAATTSSGSASTASRASSSPTSSVLYHNNGDGTFTEVSKGTDIQKSLGKALGVVATDINNDGLHGPVRRQRHGPELPVRQPRRQGSGKRSALAAEVGFSANGQAAIGDGRRRGRPRHGRLAGPVRGQRRPGDVLALQEQRERVLLRPSPRSTASRRPRGS